MSDKIPSTDPIEESFPTDSETSATMRSITRETIFGVVRKYPGNVEWELRKYFDPNYNEEDEFYEDEPIEDEEIVDEGTLRWDEYVREMMQEEEIPEDYDNNRRLDADELAEMIAYAGSVKNETLNIGALSGDPEPVMDTLCLGFTKREIYEDTLSSSVDISLAEEQLFDLIIDEKMQ